MSSGPVTYRFGVGFRNERFSAAIVAYLGEGNDALVDTHSSYGAPVLFVGGPGSDIFSITSPFSGESSVIGMSVSLIYGDTSREADVSLPGSGPDHLIGFYGLDWIYGGGGNDYINAHGLDDRVYGGAGNDTLIGGYGEDLIFGDAGNDVIYGGSPASASSPIVVMVQWNGDTDAAIPNQAMVGLPGIMAFDDASADTLHGGAGRDTIHGGGGNDIINGGPGNDRLYGGVGGGANKDIFIFNAPLIPANRDVILDFNRIEDTIHLENAVFRGIGGAGPLKKSAFKLSTQPKDSDDRIIYNKANGALSFDRDGDGPAKAVVFATLANKPAITHLDFVVI
ncbi:MAG: hypothetical protein KF723_01110 [Rhizobiaceae bacterium]|nr:hypothetical protein [Rhizobiaceae bacterium]